MSKNPRDGPSELGEEFDKLFDELGSLESAMRPKSPKRPRRTYDEKELEKLEASFAKNAYPDRNFRNALAEEMKVTQKNIQIWFQNRRARERFLRRKAQGVVENPINRMRLQMGQPSNTTNLQYSTGSCENQILEVIGQGGIRTSMEVQERRPLSSITNVQSVTQATTTQLHQTMANQQAFREQVHINDYNNLQVTLPQISENGNQGQQCIQSQPDLVFWPESMQSLMGPQLLEHRDKELVCICQQRSQFLQDSCNDGMQSLLEPQSCQHCYRDLHQDGVEPRMFRVSLSSISNLPKISTSSFSEMILGMGISNLPDLSTDVTDLSPTFDCVFGF